MASSAPKHPYRYHAFGLTIDSSIDLTTFPKADRVSGPVVRITEGEVDPEEWSAFNNYGDQILGRAEDVMRFKLDRGREIIFDPLPDADMAFLRAILSGELMAALLRQRGFLTLHASAIEIDGKAVAFIGGSGYGKSTIATRLVAESGTLLTDDVLAIDLNERPPVVYPGQLEVKLNTDSSAQLQIATPSERRAHSYTDKRLYAFDSDPGKKYELQKVYLLEPVKRSSNAIAAIKPSNALLELIRHTRGVGMLKSPDFKKEHLHQCGQLADAVPVELLHRTGDLRDLDELCELVLNDLQILDSTEPG